MVSIHFDAEGWRARLDEDFNDVNVARIAEGLGTVWSETVPYGHVLVGYDTRAQARHHAEVAAGILSACGLRVSLSTEPCPLPVLGWSASSSDDICGALMIGASGAPADYQGLCIRSGLGLIETDEFLEEVEDRIPSECTLEPGDFEDINLIDPYVADLAARVDADLIERAQLKVVVDPMYGTGCGILVNLLRSMGVEAAEIHGEKREDFAGIHPRPVEPWLDDCERAVVETESVAGFVLDGDADRLGLIDEYGHFVTPHRMAPLVLERLVAKQGPGRVAIQLNGSSYIRRQAARFDCHVSAVPVGFVRTYREMARHDGIMAVGEGGGIAVPSHMLERDGIYVALMLVELLAERQLTTHELVEELDEDLGHLEYGQHDMRLDAAQVQAFRNLLPGLNPATVCDMTPVAVSHADGLRLQFEDDSWLLIRPSRSEPLVRIYAEAQTAAEKDALLKAGCEIAQRDR